MFCINIKQDVSNNTLIAYVMLHMWNIGTIRQKKHKYLQINLKVKFSSWKISKYETLILG